MKNPWAEKENISLPPDCLDWELLSPEQRRWCKAFDGVTIQYIIALPTYSNTSNINWFFPMFSHLFSTTVSEIFHSEKCFQLTKIEMMPLNFSSTKSQIILLLKYWTGSHCKDKNSCLGENNSRLEQKNVNFRSFQRAPDLNNLSVKAFSLITFVFLTLPLLKSEWRLGMALLTSSCLTQVTRVSKRRGKRKVLEFLYLEMVAAAPFASGRRGKGGFGLLPRCPRTRTPLALTSGWARWRAAATFHCSN